MVNLIISDDQNSFKIDSKFKNKNILNKAFKPS